MINSMKQKSKKIIIQGMGHKIVTIIKQLKY